MGEAKSFASLSSGLLARKGAAKPAMRRPVPSNHPSTHDHDDLGWNDMGYDVDPDQNAEQEQDSHYHYNPLMGAIPDADAGTRARQEEVAERLSTSKLPSDEKLNEAAQEIEALEHKNGVEPAAAHSLFEATDEDGTTETERGDEQDDAPAGPLLAVKPRQAERVARAEHAPNPAPATQKPIRSKASTSKVAGPVAAKDKTAFTLRLDRERHLQLRLACAVRNVSAQKLVTSALDELLANMPEVGELTRHLPSRSA